MSELICARYGGQNARAGIPHLMFDILSIVPGPAIPVAFPDLSFFFQLKKKAPLCAQLFIMDNFKFIK